MTGPRNSRNQHHIDCPITLSQFFRPLPSHQIFPSIAGRPHSSSHRAFSRRFLAKAHVGYFPASFADSSSLISSTFICSTVVKLSRIRRTCVPNMVNVNRPSNPDLGGNKTVSFQGSSSVMPCFTHRATMTIFKMSMSPWFLGSATNPSRVEKVQAQDREVQNTNCRKN